MNRIQIAQNSYWVGKIDDRKVPFHRLILEKGTTYNSYLLDTAKPTIIDTVDIAYGREYVENLKGIMDLNNLHYIVINHVEPDHAGALPALLNNAPNAKVVATALGAGLLKGMFKLNNREFIIVKDGDDLDIGGKTLRFFETPYLHTEETMITYGVEDKIMYPCDLFSTHIAVRDIFDDLASEDFDEDFKVYYSLIMSPHRMYVRNMLEKIKVLQIDTIAPSHGYILRKNTEKYTSLYDEMSSSDGKAKDKKVVIAYSTMTGNTTKIAGELKNGLNELGIEARVFNLRDADIDDVSQEIADSHGLFIGSSTKYGDMVGKVEDLLRVLKSMDMSGKFASAFGSYGWSGEAICHIEDYLKGSGFNVIDNGYLIKNTGIDTHILPLRVKFADKSGLTLAREAGRIFGEQILKM